MPETRAHLPFHYLLELYSLVVLVALVSFFSVCRLVQDVVREGGQIWLSVVHLEGDHCHADFRSHVKQKCWLLGRSAQSRISSDCAPVWSLLGFFKLKVLARGQRFIWFTHSHRCATHLCRRTSAINSVGSSRDVRMVLASGDLPGPSGFYLFGTLPPFTQGWSGRPSSGTAVIVCYVIL